MSQAEDRLKSLGLVLPEPVAPVANYVPFVRSGAMIHISGQVSTDAGGGIKGTVGVDVDLEMAQRAARLCGLNLIAQMKAACGGDLDREVQRQAIDPHGRAGMAADVAEHLDHQVRTAVQHLGNIEKLRTRLHESAELDHARHPVEVDAVVQLA